MYLIVVDNHALECHAHMKNGRKILDAVEGDLRYVKQPRYATNLHKRSVGLDGFNMAVAFRGSNTNSIKQVSHVNQSPCRRVLTNGTRQDKISG